MLIDQRVNWLYRWLINNESACPGFVALLASSARCRRPHWRRPRWPPAVLLWNPYSPILRSPTKNVLSIIPYTKLEPIEISSHHYPISYSNISPNLPTYTDITNLLSIISYNNHPISSTVQYSHRILTASHSERRWPTARGPPCLRRSGVPGRERTSADPADDQHLGPGESGESLSWCI